jgi:hypothetical protein
MIIILQLWQNTWSCNTGCVVVIIQQGNTETERTKLEKRKSWCSKMAVSPSSSGMKKSMWQWSLLNTLLSPDGNDKVEQKLKSVCVCYYNLHRSCGDRSAAAETKRMNKWYVKLFRRVLNATILFPWIIYRNKIGWMSRIKIGWKVDYLKFRTDFTEGLLLKYSVQHKILGHHSYGNTAKGLI